MIRKFLITIVVLALATQVFAYEQALHKRMTLKGFEVASSQNDFIKVLGMKANDVNDAKEWIQTGANDEDDTFSTTPLRVRNHFFDPRDFAPLTVPDYSASPFFVPCSISFIRADQWAVDPALGNNYDIHHARLYELDAVLGPNPGTRSSGMHFMFEALGHVAHLVEDMAQPEHTRNDQHLTWSNYFIGGAPAASIWEAWSAEHFTSGPDAFFSGYPVVKMPDYYDYFHDATGRGMADFSNRNFFTQDTNEFDERPLPPKTPMGCYNYPTPSVDPAAAGVTRTVTEQYYVAGALTSGPVAETYFSGPIDDKYTGSHEIDNAQTVASSLDLETRQFGVATYSLDDGSYLTRGAFLLPRAVGYAAGIIDHFFRGRIGAAWTDNNNGTYKLVLTNKSSEAIGSDAAVAVLYNPGPSGSSSDDTALALGLTKLSQALSGFTGIPAGGSVTIDGVTPQGLPAGKSLLDFDRRIVLVGTLGTETEVVIPLVQPAAKGLRVDVTWTDAYDGKQPFIVLRENAVYDHLAVIDNRGDFRNYIPHCELTIVDGHHAYWDIDPVDPGGYYVVGATGGSLCNEVTSATVTWIVRGDVNQTITRSLTPCSISSFGSYRP